MIWNNHLQADTVCYLVAVRDDGTVIGTVTGVDHKRLFNDPEDGSSLWTLAVDPSAGLPGVGAALTRALARIFRDRGRAYLDLSVAHDNEAAIGLYEKLGFHRVPVLAVKRKNAINEPLFTHPPETIDDLNPYARIIADEAVRRGIHVEVIDAETGEMRLSHGGRTVITRESLSEYTSAVAMSRCDDKRLTRRIVSEAGIAVPRGRLATFDADDHAFLAEVGDVVVKPTRGEQGQGHHRRGRRPRGTRRRPGPGPRTAPRGPHRAARPRRRPAAGGDQRQGGGGRAAPARRGGRHRQAHRPGTDRDPEPPPRGPTGGESRIPMDDVTESTVREAGWALDDVLPDGVRLRVRRTANLHQGGTIHDVTAEVNPELRRVAVAAAEAVGIPVTGIDLLVPDVTAEEYVFVEANERPGLANHEPQPTAQAFVDFLFPGRPGLPQAWTPEEPPGRD